MQRITIVAPYAFGYTKLIHEKLQADPQIEATIAYLDYPAFHYRNTFHRIQNSLSKLLLNKNLKKTFVANRIMKLCKESPRQDVVLMIRPDLLSDKVLTEVKSNCDKMIAYYWDSSQRFPRFIEVARFFDSVYSYDRNDVAEYGYQFLTNYIFSQEPATSEHDYLFFNISTNDYRLPILEKLAAYIKHNNWSSKLLVYNGSEMEVSHVELITEQLSIAETERLLKNCKIIVEIQRTEQIGLSFRIFEAIGLRKKLITTNKDVVNYDFYDPQNFLVIDPAHIEIPEAFVTSPYKELPAAIREKYQLEQWIRRVFEL